MGGWSRCRDVIGGHAFQPSRRDLRPAGEVPALKNAGLLSGVPLGQQPDGAVRVHFAKAVLRRGSITNPEVPY